MEKGREILCRDNLLDERVDPNLVVEKTLEQKFHNIQRKVEIFEQNLNQLSVEFQKSTLLAKKKLANMEKFVKEKRHVIETVAARQKMFSLSNET